jgi:hypothetical protein
MYKISQGVHSPVLKKYLPFLYFSTYCIFMSLQPHRITALAPAPDAAPAPTPQQLIVVVFAACQSYLLMPMFPY